jgi:excisionase family DNA binding protein
MACSVGRPELSSGPPHARPLLRIPMVLNTKESDNQMNVETIERLISFVSKLERALDKYLDDQGDVRDEPSITVSVPEAAAMLGVSRAFAYKLIREGQLDALRIGRTKLLVPRTAIARFLASRPEYPGKSETNNG